MRPATDTLLKTVRESPPALKTPRRTPDAGPGLFDSRTPLLPKKYNIYKKALPETSCQGLFIKKISNSIICCTMLVVYVIWLYN